MSVRSDHLATRCEESTATLRQEPAPRQAHGATGSIRAGSALQSASVAAAPRSHTGRYLVLAATAAAVTVVTALLLGGGRPETAPDGIPDAGKVTGWALPLAKVAFDISAIGSIGCLLFAAVLVGAGQGIDRTLSPPALRAVRAASWWALGWCASTLAVLGLSLSNIVGLPLHRIVSPAVLGALPWTVPLSRSLLLTAVATLALAGFTRQTMTRTEAAKLLILAVAAVIPVLFTGHAATAVDHDLATSSLIVHVIAATLWLGGLLALLVYGRADPQVLASALPRFSALALGCFVLVALSGALSALYRLGPSPQNWLTSYGALLAAKGAALILLGWMGREHRNRTLPRVLAGRSRAFLRLAGGEIVLMAAAVGLAVALGRTPGPTLASADPSHALRHPSLTWEVLPWSPSRLLTEWRPDATVLAAAGLSVVAYLVAVRRLSSRGQRWPMGRTISTMSGLAAATFALCGGLANYSTALFSMQVAQLLVMATVVPLLLTLGMPLALVHQVRASVVPGTGNHVTSTGNQVTAAGNRVTTSASYDGSPMVLGEMARFLGNPVNGLLLLVAVLVGLYTTPLFEMSLRSFSLHLLWNLLALAAGLSFFWSVLGVDAASQHREPIARALLVGAFFVFLAVFGAVLVGSQDLYGARWFDIEIGWSWSDPVADQQRGGWLVWAFGLVLTPVMLLVLWVRSQRHTGSNKPRHPLGSGARGLPAKRATVVRRCACGGASHRVMPEAGRAAP